MADPECYITYNQINQFYLHVYVSAEKFLEGVEVNQNYAILLLHLIDKDTVDLTIRIAGAIAFKNYIKRNWPVVCSHNIKF